MPLRANHWLANVPAPRHGGAVYEELRALGVPPESVVDFSVNSNPFGPPPGLAEALRRIRISAYPDPACTRLRERLANLNRVAPEQVLAGNGSMELIRLAAAAYLAPGDVALVLGPTFDEYRRSALAVGARVEEVRVHAPGSTAPSFSECVRAAASIAPRMLFFCNPNNPTGHYVGPAQMSALLERLPDTLVVLDEAYAAFVPERWDIAPLLERHPNLLVLRSMTKDYAIPGLRLGYAFGAPDVIAALATVQQPWSVNALAQEAGLFCLAQTTFLIRSLAATHTAKDELVAGLSKAGFAPLSSAMNFFLLPIGSGAAVRRELLTDGLLVRDCASFGLPGFIRIAARKPNENRRLVRALAKLRQNGKIVIPSTNETTGTDNVE